MSHLALYRKYRPTTFDGVVGQDAVVTALRNQVKYGQLGHAYLFCGTRGTGKTSTAKIFARAVNCLHPVEGNPCNECELCKQAESGFNLIEIDAASNNGVDSMRNLREEVQYTPSKGKYKVYIIDEAHMLTTQAFNALLKTLEEPPEHVIFILATTEPQTILPTIVSRCQRYDFKRITAQEIAGRLQMVCEQEAIQISQDALHYIAVLASGGLRDALSILDQCHAYYMNQEITLAKVQDVMGAVDNSVFVSMTRAVMEQDVASLLELINEVFAQGRDVLQFITDWQGYLRNLLVYHVLQNKGLDLIETDPQTLAQLQEQAPAISTKDITRWIEELAKLAALLKRVSQKRVVMETQLIALLAQTEEPEHTVKPQRKVPRAMPSMAVPGKAMPSMATPGMAMPPTEAVQPAPQQPAASTHKNRDGAEPQGAADEDIQKVLREWPAIRQHIVEQWQSLRSLNLLQLKAGNAPGQLVLKASNSIYCRQLEMNQGEKLHWIEDEIEKATGLRFQVRAVCETQKAPDGDLSDKIQQIHTDVNWRN